MKHITSNAFYSILFSSISLRQLLKAFNYLFCNRHREVNERLSCSVSFVAAEERFDHVSARYLSKTGLLRKLDMCEITKRKLNVEVSRNLRVFEVWTGSANVVCYIEICPRWNYTECNKRKKEKKLSENISLRGKSVRSSSLLRN